MAMQNLEVKTCSLLGSSRDLHIERGKTAFDCIITIACCDRRLLIIVQVHGYTRVYECTELSLAAERAETREAEQLRSQSIRGSAPCIALCSVMRTRACTRYECSRVCVLVSILMRSL